ncbi:TPA: hypothetical protein N0F65_000842 [Lagenidium giganteum]|uniref:Mediator of RNA polymerase II transcription subunit 7 n=1 Tax=Lagenidium giganteum TaxID=4803 RepID=A0AAV2YUE1_9STRA|nr:TPA: hypothetical protein N0F65_000842 [Lagenidium giganteum]
MSQEEAGGDAPEIVSAFPKPPAFFVLYKDGVDSGPPPPDTMHPTYHMFGTPYSTEDMVPDLLQTDDRKLYLKGGDDAKEAEDSRSGDGCRMNRSLLANFVELVDILMKNPSMFNDKLNDIELLFLNMHNLINAFRPHQARETIIEMLKEQIRERKEAVQDIRRTIDESRKAVEATHADLHEIGDDARRNEEADVEMDDVKKEESDAQSNGSSAGAASQHNAQVEQSAVRAVASMQRYASALMVIFVDTERARDTADP